MMMSIGSDKKIKAHWSVPHRIKSRALNSYTLEDLEGRELNGRFSARRLREFVAEEGTDLFADQEEFMSSRREQVEAEDGT
ncbi:hypothetical protein CVT24_002611 [Panaeolus cyanescens]|uniref:Uncharacterized protein n=1 Tax=Panaeolus cyanescens TaxID=181874 RepID=A0A409YU20_9AGAR|nr:hypothetical protein CVT24_002611 [Panaeolus cyanescens]